MKVSKMDKVSCKINAFWDDEAAVWVASSDDVPGLATEADTLEALSIKLRSMVPELLQVNNVIPKDKESTVLIELTSQRSELIQVAT